MNSQANIELIADKIIEITDTLLQTPHNKWPKRPIIVHKILEAIIDVEFKDTISDYTVHRGEHLVYLHTHKKVISFWVHNYILPTYNYLKNTSIEDNNGNRVYNYSRFPGASYTTEIDFRNHIIYELPSTIRRIKDQLKCKDKK